MNATPIPAVPTLRWDRKWVGVLLAYLALLAVIDLSAYLGVIPTRLNGIPYYDTLGHFFLIGLAGLFTHRAMSRWTIRVAGLAIPMGIAIVGLLAGLEECLQVLSPMRSPSLGDFAADVVGVGTFGLLDGRLARWRR